jgi:hypothetical protein
MQRNDSGAAPPGGPPRPSKRRVTEILVVVVLLVAAGVVVKVVLGPEQPPEVITPGSTIVPPPTPDEATLEARARACLSSHRRGLGKVTKVTGAVRTYRLQSVPDRRTYDLRDARIVGYPHTHRYPLLIGKQRPGTGNCVVGGTIVGAQSRDLTWQTMKSTLDGDGLNFKGYGGVIDGIRVDNVEDGVGTIAGDPEGILIRNAYMTYIRDDCIENDFVVGLIVKDSLLDGCFFGLSQRPALGTNPKAPPAGERTLLDGVLMRLEPMPYEQSKARCSADGLGTGGFFKWSPYANKLVVRNSILFAERVAALCRSPMNFPENATFENVTLVWTGPGDYPGSLPASGVTVTRDRQVWDQAKADWLERHGYASQP